MNVRCPHCATSYRLPPELMGAGGARVSCPSCSGTFEVDRMGVVTAREGAGAAARVLETAPAEAAPAPSPRPAAEAAPAAPTPLDAAREVLATLAAEHGAAIEDSIARGRLFSEHGARLVEAYDAYRRLTARRADAGPFRQALRERWGVDLTPHWGESEPH